VEGPRGQTQEERLLDFQSPKITFEQVEENHGTFVVEPLDRGFGYTFGNSLRRVLLSSLEGAAIFSVKIEGVSHEFSTIPGVREDVTDIILNIKKVALVLHGDDDEIDVELHAEGPGLVTAGAIEALSNLEVVNADTPIATLEEGAHLDMVMSVRRGRGYARAEDNKRVGAVLGEIPIDSIFSPVSRVSYEVGSARVGQRTDYDKLTLEIETNGAMDPHESLARAAELLIHRLSLFADEERLREQEVSDQELLATLPAPGSEYDEMLIEELELGVRSYNCLKREGVVTVGELMSRTEAELLNIPNFGKKSIEEVKERLGEKGLKLKGDLSGDEDPAEEEVAAAGPDLTEMGIEELEADVRTYNRLKAEGIETVGDLVLRTRAELLGIPKFGEKSVEQVTERLETKGLKLRGE